MKGVIDMEIFIAALIGLLVGIGGTVGITAATQPKDTKDETGLAQQEIVQQLTDLDITKPLCTPKFIKENGDLLCRQITCLQFSRGTDSQTGGKQCEEISNIANTIAIEKWCNQHQDIAVKQDCIDLFFKRK
jgi:hypothetical protein